MPCSSLPPAPPAAAQAERLPPPPAAALLAEFRERRDRLLVTPGAGPRDYAALVTAFAARLPPPEALSLDDLAAAAFEGLLDAAARDRALAASFAREREDPLGPGGARAVAVRLRLLVGPGGPPDSGGTPEVRACLGALVAHPGAPALAASRHAGDLMGAIAGAGGVDEYGEPIADLAARLDPAQCPVLAGDLARLALLLARATPGDPARLQVSWRRLLAFGQRAADLLPPDARVARSARGQARWLERRLSGLSLVTPDADPARPTAAQSGPLEAVTSWARAAGTDAWHRWRAGAAAGDGPDGPFQLVPPLPETGARFFAGVTAGARAGTAWSPPFAFAAGDLGADPARGTGFARAVRLRVPPYEAGADEVRVAEGDDQATRVTRLSLGLRMNGLRLGEVRAPEVTLLPGGNVRAKDVSVRVLGQRVVTLPRLDSRIATGGGPAPELPPDPPRGQSPWTQWLKLPTIGLFENKVTFGYANEIKFGGRWTSRFGFQTYANDPRSSHLSLVYNLRAVTDDLDRVMNRTELQDNFLDSYYFTARRDDPGGENAELFVPARLLGVYRAQNRFYTSPRSGESATVDVPFSAQIEVRGTPLGRGLGMRAQAAWEHVRDEASGEDRRLTLLFVAGPPSLPVGGRTPGRTRAPAEVFLRAEGAARVGASSQYAWLRGIVGASVAVGEGARLSAAYYQSGESGTARYFYDRVAADRGVSLRGDLTLGTVRLAYLNRYSDDARGWVRDQYRLAVNVGGLEPYAIYDARFRSLNVGFNLRFSPYLARFDAPPPAGIPEPERAP